jgi:hypothetical protein
LPAGGGRGRGGRAGTLVIADEERGGRGYGGATHAIMPMGMQPRPDCMQLFSRESELACWGLGMYATFPFHINSCSRCLDRIHLPPTAGVARLTRRNG